MGDSNKWKPIVFTASVIIAFTFILILFVHRSNQRQRLCPNAQDLLYLEAPSNGSSSRNTSGEEVGSCHREFTTGPCAKNMVLYPKPLNESVGVCDCDFTHNERGLVYHEQTGQCYFIFTQGYCSSTHWLVPYPKDSTCAENLCARCEINLCASFPDNGFEWVQVKDGSCAELELGGHPTCQSSEDVIHFVKPKAFPTCERRKPSKPLTFSTGGIGVPPARCPHGYSRTTLGHCAINFDFD